MSELERSLTAIDWLPRLNAVEAMKQQQLETSSSTDPTEDPTTNTTTTTATTEVVRVSQDLDNKKPAHSYATLIKMAINSTAKHQMTLSEIYKWVCDNFDYYRRCGHNGWKNSIRHNLSLNKSFMKVPRPQHDPGKGCYWTINTNNSVNMPSKKKKRKNAPLLAVAPYIPENDVSVQHGDGSVCKTPGKKLLDQHPNLSQLITGKQCEEMDNLPLDDCSKNKSFLSEADAAFLGSFLEIPGHSSSKQRTVETIKTTTLDLSYLDFIPDEFSLDTMPLNMPSLRNEEADDELPEIEFDWDSLL